MHWKIENNKALFVSLCRKWRGSGSWAAVPLQRSASRPRSSQRRQTLSCLPQVDGRANAPKAHGSPRRATRTLGVKWHLGQRSSGFIHFCSGGDGLLDSVRLVLSSMRPLFLVLASISLCALLLAAQSKSNTAASVAAAPAPAVLALPSKGPPPTGTGSVPSRPRRDVVPLHSIRVFWSSFFLIGEDAGRGKMSCFWWPPSQLAAGTFPCTLVLIFV